MDTGNSVFQRFVGGFILQPSLKTTTLKQKITTGLVTTETPETRVISC